VAHEAVLRSEEEVAFERLERVTDDVWDVSRFSV